MTMQDLYDWIELPYPVILKLEKIGQKIDLEQIELKLGQLMDIRTSAQAYNDLEKIFCSEEEQKDNMEMLYCQLECARRVYEQYQKKKIVKKIYIDTMKCFTRFLEECEKKNRWMFFDRGWWTYRQISMNIFRIGELEYQFKEYGGEPVIGIHIPSDANLSKKAVEDSVRQAGEFFHRYYGEYKYENYTCNSWLMAPILKQLLSLDSNIISFQDHFDIIEENKQDKGYIEWLFQVPIQTDYKNLPEKTSLQRKVKELLLHGGTIGCAYGRMKAIF